MLSGVFLSFSFILLTGFGIEIPNLKNQGPQSEFNTELPDGRFKKTVRDGFYNSGMTIPKSQILQYMWYGTASQIGAFEIRINDLRRNHLEGIDTSNFVKSDIMNIHVGVLPFLQEKNIVEVKSSVESPYNFTIVQSGKEVCNLVLKKNEFVRCEFRAINLPRFVLEDYEKIDPSELQYADNQVEVLQKAEGLFVDPRYVLAVGGISRLKKPLVSSSYRFANLKIARFSSVKHIDKSATVTQNANASVFLAFSVEDGVLQSTDDAGEVYGLSILQIGGQHIVFAEYAKLELFRRLDF